jgi:nitrite reductase/ring-hydroxylating ferredoxin subunit
MGFELDIDGSAVNLFVVHRDGRFSAYINSCPHTGANLEWLDNQFLDMDNTFIQCSTHDALFDIDSGLCVAGPCVGDSLHSVTLSQHDEQLFAELDV